MEHFDLIVIGGDAAGMSAASQTRRTNRKMTIAVFEKGEHVSYAACGMPYYISGEIADHLNLVAIDRDDFTNKRNINIFTESEVTEVNFDKKTVTALIGSQNRHYTYSKLVIATGARALIPPIEGTQNEGVFFLRNLTQGISIREYIDNKKPKSGIIIGGGFIGLEMAEALRKRDIETTVIEMMPSVAISMSQDIRKRIIRELEENRVSIITKKAVTSISRDNNELTVHTESDTLKTDFLLISVGIIPNTDFLKGTPLKLNDKGAIIVDEKSSTNITDVYAAGDCATVKHLVTGQDFYMPLGSTANKQGRVAGLQAAGISTEQFKGIAGSQFVKVFNLEVGKTGFNEEDARRISMPAVSATTLWKSRAGYYPGSEVILVNLTINPDTHVIIGGEFAGTQGAALRTNVIATAITAGMTIEELAYLDLGYAPPFSPVWDPVNAAAQKFIKRKLA